MLTSSGVTLWDNAICCCPGGRACAAAARFASLFASSLFASKSFLLSRTARRAQSSLSTSAWRSNHSCFGWHVRTPTSNGSRCISISFGPPAYVFPQKAHFLSLRTVFLRPCSSMTVLHCNAFPSSCSISLVFHAGRSGGAFTLCAIRLVNGFGNSRDTCTFCCGFAFFCAQQPPEMALQLIKYLPCCMSGEKATRPGGPG